MRYMGSKRSIAAEYLPFLMQYRKPDQVWVEPFCGGCNSIDKVPGFRIANDLHPQLITMWQALQQGWEPPDEVSELEYFRLKKEMRNDPVTGFAGFCCAFSGQWFASYAKDDTGVNYAAQGKRTVTKQIAAMPADQVWFHHGSYDSFVIPPNSFIYCDPPYADTGSYAVGDFDHRKFWKWANRMVAAGHTVVVAEYTAPPDWAPIWEKAKKTRLNVHTATASMERIFARAQSYDEEAAREYYDPPLHKMYTIKQVLHFVARAGQKDNSHVVIEGLRATASNELFTASAPINIPFDCKPHARTLHQAVKLAEETKAGVSIDRTNAGRLRVSSDKLKVFIDVLPDEFIAQPLTPQGIFINNPKAVYAGLVTLSGIMCRNDLRAFANGVAVGHNSCMATNNVIFGEVWHGSALPFDVVVPAETVDQIVAINEEPESIQVSINSITFWYTGERRITSCLVAESFPMTQVSKLLDRPAEFTEIPVEFYDSLKQLKRVGKSDDKSMVVVYADRIATSEEEEIGASIEVATGLHDVVRLRLDEAINLDGLASRIDWSMYPTPLSFQGPNLRGVIAPMTARPKN